MPLLLAVVLIITAAWQGFSLYLSRRQVRVVRFHRDEVPIRFSGSLTLTEHQKAADYTVANVILNAISSSFAFVVSVVLILFVMNPLAGAVSAIVQPVVLQDVLVFTLLLVIGTVLEFPFRIYSKFVIEAKFGFNQTTARLFVVDLIRTTAISAVLGLPLMTGLFWVMHNLSGLWWLYVWMAMVVMMLAAPTVYSHLIAPLFNKFEPLTDASLAERIEGLLTKCGFKTSGLFTMDASKRSNKGNAFFIGFGRTKRIVLFDTLISKHEPVEVEWIVAHELGHFKFKHVFFGIIRGVVVTFVMLAGIGWVCKQPWLLPGFGFTHQSLALAFLAANMLLGLISPLGGLISAWISRRHEFQADGYAKQMVGEEAGVSALQRLSRDNAATLTPDPLYAMVNYSHPPIHERIDHIRAVA